MLSGSATNEGHLLLCGPSPRRLRHANGVFNFLTIKPLSPSPPRATSSKERCFNLRDRPRRPMTQRGRSLQVPYPAKSNLPPLVPEHGSPCLMSERGLGGDVQIRGVMALAERARSMPPILGCAPCAPTSFATRRPDHIAMTRGG